METTPDFDADNNPGKKLEHNGENLPQASLPAENTPAPENQGEISPGDVSAAPDQPLQDAVQQAYTDYVNLNDEQRRKFTAALLNPAQYPEITTSKGSNGNGRRTRWQASPLKDLASLEPVEIYTGVDLPPPWKLFTLEDAYQERPPVQYAIQGLFALPSLNIVYGAPGSLKSFLLQDAAVCIAAGIPWLSPAAWLKDNLARALLTRQLNTMWLDYDNGMRRTHDRFAALGRAYQLNSKVPLFYDSLRTPVLDFTNAILVQELRSVLLDYQIGMLFLDNLGIVSGEADENSAEMVRVMANIRRLAEGTGTSIVPIHHQRKSMGTGTRAGDGLRGHSGIEASLDTALHVEREDQSDLVTVRATKVRGEDILPFSAKFTFEKLPDGQLWKARFFGVAADDTHSNAAIEREILSILGNQSLNKTDLVKQVKNTLSEVGVNRIRDLIDRLAYTGKLHISTGRNNTEKIYSRA